MSLPAHPVPCRSKTDQVSPDQPQHGVAPPLCSPSVWAQPTPCVAACQGRGRGSAWVSATSGAHLGLTAARCLSHCYFKHRGWWTRTVPPGSPHPNTAGGCAVTPGAGGPGPGLGGSRWSWCQPLFAFLPVAWRSVCSRDGFLLPGLKQVAFICRDWLMRSGATYHLPTQPPCSLFLVFFPQTHFSGKDARNALLSSRISLNKEDG